MSYPDKSYTLHMEHLRKQTYVQECDYCDLKAYWQRIFNNQEIEELY